MRTKNKRSRRKSNFTRFFLRGLVTLAPVVLTLVVFGLLFQFVDRYVTGPINSVIYWSLEGTAPGWKALDRLAVHPYDSEYLDLSVLPESLQDVARANPEGTSSPQFLVELETHRTENESFFRDLEELGVHAERVRDDVQKVVHPFIGVLLSLLLVLWMGWLVGGFVGRRLVQALDQAMHVIPIVKSVYPYSKQLVEFFFAERTLEFETVVAIRYPSKHLWSLAFVTSNSLKTLRQATGEPFITVFVPSSPMPMTGYTIFIKEEDTVPLPMSVDEALRVTMSGGVLVPPREKVRDRDEMEFEPQLFPTDPDPDTDPLEEESA